MELTDKERAVFVVLITEIGRDLSELAKHPDLPQHGETRPLMLEMIRKLQIMAEMVRHSDSDRRISLS